MLNNLNEGIFTFWHESYLENENKVIEFIMQRFEPSGEIEAPMIEKNIFTDNKGE
jgi:hypothetical protein